MIQDMPEDVFSKSPSITVPPELLQAIKKSPDAADSTRNWGREDGYYDEEDSINQPSTKEEETLWEHPEINQQAADEPPISFQKERLASAICIKSNLSSVLASQSDPKNPFLAFFNLHVSNFKAEWIKRSRKPPHQDLLRVCKNISSYF
jgi:hypothetical protein